MTSPSASTCDRENEKRADSSQNIDSHARPDVAESPYHTLLMNFDADVASIDNSDQHQPQNVINKDVVLTSGNQDVDSKTDLNFDNFMSVLTPQNSGKSHLHTI